MSDVIAQEASPAIEAHLDSSRIQHALIIGGTLVVVIFTYWIARLALGEMAARGKTTLIILGITVMLWLTSGQHGVKAGAIALLAAVALTALGVLDRHDVGSIDSDILILMGAGCR